MEGRQFSQSFQALAPVDAILVIAETSIGHGQKTEFVDGRFLGPDAKVQVMDGFRRMKTPSQVFCLPLPLSRIGEKGTDQLFVHFSFLAMEGDPQGLEVVTVTAFVTVD